MGSRVDERDPPVAGVGWFETVILTTRKNLKSVMDVPGKWIDRVRQRRSKDELILDLNNLTSDTYGRRDFKITRHTAPLNKRSEIQHHDRSERRSKTNRRMCSGSSSC